MFACCVRPGASLLRAATLFSVASISPFCFLGLRDAVAPLFAGGKPSTDVEGDVPHELVLRLGLAAVIHFCSFFARDVRAPYPRAHLTPPADV